MARVFLPPEAFSQGGVVTIEGPTYHHLIRVLRLRVGDSLVAADGSGREFLARLVAVASRTAQAEVLAERPGSAEPPVEVLLILGLPKGEKLALITQKATELGVSCIMPVPTRRSVPRLEAGKGRVRWERWQAIAEAAACQSGRSLVPTVAGARCLEEALRALPPDTLFIMPWEGEKVTDLQKTLRRVRSQSFPRVAVLVGPEGGWATEEVELARSHGAITVSLGPRILRCETAAIATLAIILYELGGLGVG